MAMPLQTLELEGGSFFDGSLLDLIDDLEVRASPERVLLPHSLRSKRKYVAESVASTNTS